MGIIVFVKAVVKLDKTNDPKTVHGHRMRTRCFFHRAHRGHQVHFEPQLATEPGQQICHRYLWMTSNLRGSMVSGEPLSPDYFYLSFKLNLVWKGFFTALI